MHPLACTQQVLRIELDDLQQFDGGLVERVEKNAQREVRLFEEAADDLFEAITLART